MAVGPGKGAGLVVISRKGAGATYNSQATPAPSDSLNWPVGLWGFGLRRAARSAHSAQWCVVEIRAGARSILGGYF